jgi:indolepyruvate ferredoxin oxidoreductase
LAEAFASHGRLEFHLAPPILGRKDANGRPVKSRFGPWILPLFSVLASLKRLRGTPLDLFGRSAERRMERGLIAEFEADMAHAAEELDADNGERFAALMALPMEIRGYGHVKEATVQAWRRKRGDIIAPLTGSMVAERIAAE